MSPGREFRVPSTSPGSTLNSNWRKTSPGREFRVPSTSAGSTLSSDIDVSLDGDEVPGETPGGPRVISPRTTRVILGIINGHENLLHLVEHVDAQQNVVSAPTWERIGGGTLAELLARTRTVHSLPTKRNPGLPESFIWHTLISLLKAATYLHAGKTNHLGDKNHAGWMIVHNFINPRNIFYKTAVDGQEHSICKLGNFTQCVVLPDNRTPKSLEECDRRSNAFPVVLPYEETGYEAPELLDKLGTVPGPASDLWAIGAVAITMMTGYHPWDFLREAAFLAYSIRSESSAMLHESWRDVPHVGRWAILRSIDKKAEVIASLPSEYSYRLKEFVETLLLIDAGERGAAEHVLENAVKRYEEQADEGFSDYREPGRAEKAARTLDNSRRVRRAVRE